jgi:hypothetical protein
MADLVRRCSITGRNFVVTEAEQEHIALLNRLLPLLGNTLPLPDIHPLEALRRLAAWVNFLHLVHGRSAFSGKPQLTRYHPQLGTRICTPEEFWGEAVDNLEFGRPFDFSRPFFDQWLELYRVCYILPLIQVNCEGSEYVNGATNLKDCYLCFNTVESQDCLYCFNHFNGSDNIECVGAGRSQYCYGCVTIENCYECQHCQDCVNSSQCFGCTDLIGCHECYGCVGLRNARCHIYNQPAAPEQYRLWLQQRGLGDYERRREALDECRSFIRGEGHVINRLINVEECSGDYLRNSHRAFQCWFSDHLDRCGYMLSSPGCSHCWRCFGFFSEGCWESIPVRSCRDVFCYCSTGGEENVYCFHLEQNCARCFGCVGLKNKSYCILNRQYPPQEYAALTGRIIAHMRQSGEWGRFFPPRLAPHLYEHSAVQDLFVEIPRAEAARRGYRFNGVADEPAAAEGLSSSELPRRIDEVREEEILGRPFICAESGRAYNIQKKELDFYRRFQIPPPRRHWMLRVGELARSRNLVPDVEV